MGTQAKKGFRGKTSKESTQYTIRGVSQQVDSALKHRARLEKKSLNQVLRECLEKEAGIPSESSSALQHDLDSFVGMWVSDVGTEKALREVRQVDAKDWE